MCLAPIIIKTKPKTRSTKKKSYTPEARKVQVPCGKCFECFNNKRLQWWFRVQQENKFNLEPYRWFLTLTYNERKVPRRKGVRTLYKRHPQLFFKRLRKAGYKIKYILVGEYGTETRRPHYHAILWTDAPDHAISNAWKYGTIHFGTVNRNTVLYTLKYIVQTNDITRNRVRESGYQKNYAVYSRGIGESYLTPQMYDYHTKDYENPKFKAIIEGEEIPLPRYYRKKIFTTYQINKNSNAEYYRNLKQRHDHHRYLKARGVKGNYDKVLKARKLLKVKNTIQKFELKNKKYEQKWDISGCTRT